jgi:hypothetical protein
MQETALWRAWFKGCPMHWSVQGKNVGSSPKRDKTASGGSTLLEACPLEGTTLRRELLVDSMGPVLLDQRLVSVWNGRMSMILSVLKSVGS